MKRNGLVFFLFMLFAFSSLFAQGYRGKGRIKGIVYDTEGNPLEGVKISFFSVKAQSGFERVTDENGKWRAFYIKGGEYKIDFEKEGYMPKKISANINEYNKNPDHEIRLEKFEGLVITEELRGELKSGSSFFDAGEYEQAITAYTTVIEKFPDAAILYQNIGNCYFLMEQYDQAEKNYLKVLEKDPENIDAMLSIGNTYINRGNEKKAMEWYNKIEFEKINDPLVMYNLGSKFYTQNEHEKALKYFLRAVELKKDFLDALYQIGLVYLTKNNKTESINAFNTYLIYDPDSERASQVKGFIEFLKK